jgi:hypothetical protein
LCKHFRNRTDGSAKFSFFNLYILPILCRIRICTFKVAADPKFSVWHM